MEAVHPRLPNTAFSMRIIAKFLMKRKFKIDKKIITMLSPPMMAFRSMKIFDAILGKKKASIIISSFQPISLFKPMLEKNLLILPLFFLHLFLLPSSFLATLFPMSNDEKFGMAESAFSFFSEFSALFPQKYFHFIFSLISSQISRFLRAISCFSHLFSVFCDWFTSVWKMEKFEAF